MKVNTVGLRVCRVFDHFVHIPPKFPLAQSHTGDVKLVYAAIQMD